MFLSRQLAPLTLAGAMASNVITYLYISEEVSECSEYPLIA